MELRVHAQGSRLGVDRRPPARWTCRPRHGGACPCPPCVARWLPAPIRPLHRLAQGERIVRGSAGAPRPSPLTAREGELLTLLATGLTYHEAASARGISSN